MSQTFIEIIRRALDEELARDPAVHLLGEDVAAGGAFGITRGLAQKQVRFGSAEYFDLLKKSPAAAQWLALGNNVDVVLDGILVSVRE